MFSLKNARFQLCCLYSNCARHWFIAYVQRHAYVRDQHVLGYRRRSPACLSHKLTDADSQRHSFSNAFRVRHYHSLFNTDADSIDDAFPDKVANKYFQPDTVDIAKYDTEFHRVPYG